MAPSVASIAVKIQDVHRIHRFGIVVKNVADLITKACQKLKITNKKSLRICLEDDGTEVTDDDFLFNLSPHTVLVIVESGENWMGNLSYVMAAFEQVKKIHPLYRAQERIELTMNIEKDYEKMALISTLLATLDSKRQFDSRDDDPDWFRDLPDSAKCKVKVMENSAKSRLRSYFYDARRAVKATVSATTYKNQFEPVFEQFTTSLKTNDFYSGYFSRRASEELRLCDQDGWFNCEGPFDADVCGTRHIINPYDNKESRIVFSTWNLDHQIEKSRQVVPALVSAVEKCPKRGVTVNWEYFYTLLFTRTNLRLVHIACHKKCEHTTKKVDDKQHYVRQSVCASGLPVDGGNKKLMAKVKEKVALDSLASRRSSPRLNQTRI